MLILASMLVVPAILPAVGGSLIGDAGLERVASIADDRVEEGRLEAMDGPAKVIVHASDRGGLQDALSATGGADVRYRFRNLPAAYVVTRPEAVRALADHPEVTFIESAVKDLDYHLDSATVASRAREVFDPSFEPPPHIDEPSPPMTTDDGAPIDGAGVGIAVVDSGLDGLHPAFDAPGKVQANKVVTPVGIIEAGPWTELGEGHGTRLAGVAAGTGQGTSTDRDLRGAAPGASLYSFALEPQGTTLKPAIAFDWILDHGRDLDPAIRVVLNGWSCGQAGCGDPQQAHLQLASRLAEEGFAVVFPVGNGAGEGLIAATSPESTLPTPGVIGVASHDDEDAGVRSSCVGGSSSQGNAFDPATWPDIAAPGQMLWSPNAFAVDNSPRVPVLDRKSYTRSSGSSLAAAHIAGVVALMLQTNPALDSGEVEHLLEVTAHEAAPLTDGGHCPAPYIRADPANPWDAANFEAGHGLVDAMDAVQAAANFTGLPDGPAPDLEAIPDDYIHEDPVVRPGGDVFYLAGQDGLSRQAPEKVVPRVRAQTADVTITHSVEIQQTTTASAAYAEVWIGNMDQGTQHIVYCRTVDFQATVARIDGDTGGTEIVGQGEADAEPMVAGGPWLREIPVVFGEERVSAEDPEHTPRNVTFEPGDTLQVGITISDWCSLPPGSHPEGDWALYSGAKRTPSRVLLGESTTNVRPGTFEACQEIRDNARDTEPEEDVECSWIGGPRQHVPIECVEGRYRVEWFGPPGSGAAVKCGGSDAVCTVPGDPGDPWDRCEATGIAESVTAAQDICTYFTRDGEQVDGHGQCTLVR